MPAKFHALAKGALAMMLLLAGDGYAMDEAGPAAPDWSHVPWRSFHGATGLLGVDILWGFDALEVWDTTGTVEANLDFNPEARIVRAGSPENVFGVRFRWPDRMDEGYVYRYSLGFQSEEDLPDTVAIGERLVWHRSDYVCRDWPHLAGNDWSKTALVVAEYAPLADEVPTVTLAKRGGAMRFVPPVLVHRRALGAGEKLSPYERFDFSPGVSFYARPDDQNAALLDRYSLELAPTPAQPLAGPGNGPTIWVSSVFGASPVYAPWSYLGDDPAAPQALAALRKLMPYYEAAGMRGVMLPFVGFMAKDRLSDEGLNAFAQAGIDHLWAHSTTVPEERMYAWMKGFRSHHIEYLKELAEAAPDQELFVGFYEVDQRQMGWLSFPEYERYGSAPLYERNRFFWEKNSSDREEFLAAAGVLGRARTCFQASGAAYPMDYFYRAGADVTFCKDIMRQNVQIVVANGRGAGRAMDKPYGFDMDLWHSQYWTCWAPSELRDILMTYFFGGMTHHFYEMLLFTPDLKPSVLGGAALETYRIMQEHPPLGESLVPIGVLRGPAESWEHCYSRTTGFWWSTLGYPPRGENRDYDLLSVVFDDFGLHWRTDMRRLCTGTPYGPVDFVPWDVSLDHLDTFNLLAFLGPGGLTPGTLANLETYVRGGGTLIATIDQLRTLEVGQEDRLPSEVFGCRLGGTSTIEVRDQTDLEQVFKERKLSDASFEFRCLRDGDAAMTAALRREQESAPPKQVTYHDLPDFGGEVVERLPNGDPLLVHVTPGQGNAYLFTTERMLDCGWDIAEPLLRREAARAAVLEIGGDSSWLEYGFRQAPDGVVVYFLNHGQARFPSGKGADRGPWRGTVTLRLERLPLASPDASLWRVATDYALEPLPYERSGGGLRFELDVDHWCEVLISSTGKPAWTEAASGAQNQQTR